MTKKPREPRDPTDMSDPRYDPAKDPIGPFYEGNKTEGEPKPGSSDKEAYKVGPGFPPKQHWWKKGCPSPYPKGRPKKVPSMKPDIKKLFEEALNQKIQVTKADKKIMLTRLALGFEQLAIQFAKGDRYARRDVFTYAAMLGVDLQGKEVIAEALGVTHQAILDAYLRLHQTPAAEAAPDDHVKAPPDLVDDDVAKPEPKEMPAASPQRKAPAMPLEPGLDEHGKQKPRDRAFIQTVREWNLAQQKKNQEGS
jgi:hypothetical protein